MWPAPFRTDRRHSVQRAASIYAFSVWGIVRPRHDLSLRVGLVIELGARKSLIYRGIGSRCSRMVEETLHHRGTTLVGRLILASGEATRWHRDPFYPTFWS